MLMLDQCYENTGSVHGRLDMLSVFLQRKSVKILMKTHFVSEVEVYLLIECCT